MGTSTLCPTCLSKYPDIKGLIYAYGSAYGTQCADLWHKGSDYDPSVLKLTTSDKQLLRDLDIVLPEDEGHAIQR